MKSKLVLTNDYADGYANPFSYLLPCVLFYDAIRYIVVGLIGPVSSSLLAIALWFPWVLHSKSNLWRGKVTAFSPAVVVAFLLLVVAGGSIVWSSNVEMGVEKGLKFFSRGILPCILFALSCRGNNNTTLFPTFFLGLIYCFSILLFGEAELYLRLSIPGVNPIWAARTCLLYATICLWGKSLHWSYRTIGCCVGILSALLTQSRGPLVAFIIANITVMLLAIRWKKILVVGVFAFGACVIGGVFVIAATGADAFALLQKTRFFVLFSAGSLAEDATFQERLELLKNYVSFLSNSIFWGGGLGSVSPVNEREYPHNLVLEILCELGLIGFLLWLFVVLTSLLRSVRRPLLFGLLIQSLMYTLVSGDFGYNYEYLWFCFYPDRRLSKAGQVNK